MEAPGQAEVHYVPRGPGGRLAPASPSPSPAPARLALLLALLSLGLVLALLGITLSSLPDRLQRREVTQLGVEKIRVRVVEQVLGREVGLASLGLGGSRVAGSCHRACLPGSTRGRAMPRPGGGATALSLT
jgi:hypothetical protein